MTTSHFFLGISFAYTQAALRRGWEHHVTFISAFKVHGAYVRCCILRQTITLLCEGAGCEPASLLGRGFELEPAEPGASYEAFRGWLGWSVEGERVWWAEKEEWAIKMT